MNTDSEESVKSRDVTVQRQADTNSEKILAEIKKSEDQLRIIIDTIPTMAWRAKPDGFIEFLNQRWLDDTGLPLEQAAGWGWTHTGMVHADDLPSLMNTGRSTLAE